MSKALLCGCDPDDGTVCSTHKPHVSPLRDFPTKPPALKLPTDDKDRKAIPIFDGFLMYFPLACMAVAEVSRVGNDQHNPGEPLHWARNKSTDQFNTALRHMMDHGLGNRKDDDGKTWHLAKAAWRTLAALELAIEEEQKEQA